MYLEQIQALLDLCLTIMGFLDKILSIFKKPSAQEGIIEDEEGMVLGGEIDGATGEAPKKEDIEKNISSADENQSIIGGEDEQKEAAVDFKKETEIPKAPPTNQETVLKKNEPEEPKPIDMAEVEQDEKTVSPETKPSTLPSQEAAQETPATSIEELESRMKDLSKAEIKVQEGGPAEEENNKKN